MNSDSPFSAAFQPKGADEGRRATKIVATIGPASENRVGELIEAGMSVARINFSHGEPADHRRRVNTIRREAREREEAVGILADIQGPKMRLGIFPDGPVVLDVGASWELVEGGMARSPEEIPFNFKGFISSVSSGDRILLADAAVELVVESVGEDRVVGKVARGGTISDRKGVHLPDSDLTFDMPTDEDRRNIKLALDMGVDMLGISFVSNANEVERIRELAPGLLLVAKIERREALENLRGILEAADGVMVARGDLGVEIRLERLPIVQKLIIQEAMKAGKFTITATEMLESMIKASRPTRAEVTDVANAVFDGTDAVMLSAETAMGAFPIEAVEAMSRIVVAVETSQRYHDMQRVTFRENEPTFSNGTALAAAEAAEALGIGTIVCFTESGNTGRLLSRYRTGADIIALTPSERTMNAMTILAHVRPMMCARAENLEGMLMRAQDMMIERGIAVPGQEVVFVAGVPPGVSRSTNVMKLHRIGEETRMN